MVNTISKEKLRGGYYTPPEIVDFLVNWAIDSKDAKILEPCFGDGNFLVAIFQRLQTLKANKDQIVKNIYGTELNEDEFNKAQKRISKILKEDLEFDDLKLGDFFLYYNEILKDIKFDVVIGNPPFIRYQHFKEEYRERAFNIMRQVGLNPNRLTNTWVPFLLSSALLLKENGKIAMVIPAEILQVKYSAELRLFLSEFFNVITLITFEKIIFPGIQQEVVLFLGQKMRDGHGINVVQLKDERCLKEYIHKLPSKEDSKPIDHSKDKWTQYYLNKEEILLLRKLKNNKELSKFGDLADVDVGIVTGRNEFFLVDRNQIEEFQLDDYTIPLVGRTYQIEGLIFNKEDWEKNNDNNLKTNLLNLSTNGNRKLPQKVKEYIEFGEKQDFDKGYKCRIRSPWYYVPSVWVPDAFLFRQIYDGPKLILNEAKAVTTDTIHRVKFKMKNSSKKIAACFHNSLTFAFTEIMGRSYGGGVLEIEPNEAEEIPIPFFDVSEKLLDDIDVSFRKKRDINQVVDIMDKILLKEKLGLSNKSIKMLNEIWKKLSMRRINRK